MLFDTKLPNFFRTADIFRQFFSSSDMAKQVCRKKVQPLSVIFIDRRCVEILMNGTSLWRLTTVGK